MKAVQFDSYGPPEVLRYCDLDEPEPGPGQIKIKVESASVNWSDTMRRRNQDYPFPSPLPFVPGSEVAGVVAALGHGVDGPPVGTAVFALAGPDGSTGYAQYTVADAMRVIPIPPGVGLDEAASLLVAGATAMLTLSPIAELAEGESVLVGGAGGGVGTYAIQIAKVLGAKQVIGAAGTPERRDAALAVGADLVVDYTAGDWPDEVLDATDGRGVDVVLEAAGGKLFNQAFSCTAPFGRFVVLGFASGTPGRLSDEEQHRLFYKPCDNQSVHGFNIGGFFIHRPRVAVDALTTLIGLVASGEVKVQVSATLPLSEAAEAHRRLEGRDTVGKIILKPWD